MTQTHERESARRFSVLAGELDYIINNDHFRKRLVEHHFDGFEWLARLDAVMALAFEYDGGRLLPRERASTLETI
ncbi:MAG: hypothetical protein ACOYBQ_08800 [Fluviibacter sp.]|jgi:hypothetical protein